MGNLFEGRRSSSSSNYSNTGRESSGSKSSIYYTSKMQGILATKEANEKEAANLLSEYLIAKSETIFDMTKLKVEAAKMLDGFTVEEQNRILMNALVQSLCKLA